VTPEEKTKIRIRNHSKMDSRWVPLLTCVMMLFFLVGNQVDFLGTKIGEQGSNIFGLSENRSIIFSTFDICQGPLTCSQKLCSISSSPQVVMVGMQTNMYMLCPTNISGALWEYDKYVPYSVPFGWCNTLILLLFILSLIQAFFILITRRKEPLVLEVQVVIQFGILFVFLLSLAERVMSLDRIPHFLNRLYYQATILGMIIFIVQSYVIRTQE
jgi:hypothetical protein